MFVLENNEIVPAIFRDDITVESLKGYERQREQIENNIKALLNNISDDSVIVMDEETDNYYVRNKLKGFKVDSTFKIDSNKCLVYEARIPLSLVGLKTNDLAINLGINTNYNQMKKIASNSNRNRNMSPMMMGRPTMSNTLKNPFSSDTDIWVFDKIKN